MCQNKQSIPIKVMWDSNCLKVKYQFLTSICLCWVHVVSVISNLKCCQKISILHLLLFNSTRNNIDWKNIDWNNIDWNNIDWNNIDLKKMKCWSFPVHINEMSFVMVVYDKKMMIQTIIGNSCNLMYNMFAATF